MAYERDTSLKNSGWTVQQSHFVRPVEVYVIASSLVFLVLVQDWPSVLGSVTMLQLGDVAGLHCEHPYSKDIVALKHPTPQSTFSPGAAPTKYITVHAGGVGSPRVVPALQ